MTWQRSLPKSGSSHSANLQKPDVPNDELRSSAKADTRAEFMADAVDQRPIARWPRANSVVGYRHQHGGNAGLASVRYGAAPRTTQALGSGRTPPP